MALNMSLTFYCSVAKGLKISVRKFSGLISMFVEVIGEILVGGDLLPIELILTNSSSINKSVYKYNIFISVVVRKFRPITRLLT